MAPGVYYPVEGREQANRAGWLAAHWRGWVISGIEKRQSKVHEAKQGVGRERKPQHGFLWGGMLKKVGVGQDGRIAQCPPLPQPFQPRTTAVF